MNESEEEVNNHKARTRQRILTSAAKLFRENGYQGVSIDAIMADADLTRGGFYAHFKSKKDLFSAVMSRDHGFTLVLRRLRMEQGDENVKDAIDFYLSKNNLDEIGRDCPSVSLAADVARVGGEVKHANTQTMSALIEEFSRHAPEESADARERGAAALALCIGGVVLARAMEDGDLSDELLSAANRYAKLIIAP